MSRQQKVRNPLFDCILMPTAPTHQLSLLYARLEEYAVEILGRLAWLFVSLCECLRGSFCCIGGGGGEAFYEIIRRRRCGREVWEPELLHH